MTFICGNYSLLFHYNLASVEDIQACGETTQVGKVGAGKDADSGYAEHVGPAVGEVFDRFHRSLIGPEIVALHVVVMGEAVGIICVMEGKGQRAAFVSGKVGHTERDDGIVGRFWVGHHRHAFRRITSSDAEPSFT